MRHTRDKSQAGSSSFSQGVKFQADPDLDFAPPMPPQQRAQNNLPPPDADMPNAVGEAIPLSLTAPHPCPSPYREAHLRNSFLNRLKPEIASRVKQQCITWDTGSLSELERYAIHSEKILREADKRKTDKCTKDMYPATLTILQAPPALRTSTMGKRGGGRGKGRGVAVLDLMDATDVEVLLTSIRDCPAPDPCTQADHVAA